MSTSPWRQLYEEDLEEAILKTHPGYYQDILKHRRAVYRRAMLRQRSQNMPSDAPGSTHNPKEEQS